MTDEEIKKLREELKQMLDECDDEKIKALQSASTELSLSQAEIAAMQAMIEDS